MGFGMFSAQASPIAIDFGSASLKLLQVGGGGNDRPSLIAAAEIPVPDSIRGEPDRLHAFYIEWLPKILRDGKFRGKRAVIAIPGRETFTKHMQVNDADGDLDQAVNMQLQTQMGCNPGSVVVRSTEVCTVNRNGQNLKEVIVFAISKDSVMRHVEAVQKNKLEVVGVHTDTMAMVRAFDHVTRREEDAGVTTLHIDLGWGGTRVAITHGRDLVFARYVPLGGRTFDQLIAAAAHCDLAGARAHRLSLNASTGKPSLTVEPARNGSMNGAGVRGAGKAAASTARADALGAASATATAVDRRTGQAPASLNHPLPPADAPQTAVNVDLTELLETMTDELSMGLRYHQSLFGERAIDRAIFVGGEARQAWICQHIVKALRVPAQMGDPLARLDASSHPTTLGVTLGQPNPGWAVACGLCTAPTDL